MHRAGTALVMVVSAALARLAYTRFAALYDADGYYHLAVARAYAEHGIFRTLDWARFSVMHDGFGDKELLFHVLLRPFATSHDPTSAGFTALALLDGAVAALLAHEAVRAIGRWGFAVPLLLFAGSMDFVSRMARLRPEVVALLLVVGALRLAAGRRYVALALLAGIFTLTYTPFQALLGLCLLWFACSWWQERRLEWPLVLAPVLGIGVALLVHPHFPANLRVWAVQNVTFFATGAHFRPSAENAARDTRDLVLLNLGWFAGLVVLWRARTPAHSPTPDTRLRDFTLLATAAFGALYALSARFVTYFVPLATLTVLRTMHVRGEVPGRTLRVGARALPFAPVFAACLVGSLAALPVLVRLMASAAPATFRPELRADWAALGRAVPPGAKVFASWAATEQLAFWAPDARYVNVLDGVFLYAASPQLARASDDVLAGREPDVPFVVRSVFDSDYVADDGDHPLARARLADDPRIGRRHDGTAWLYELVDGQNAAFLLDWTVLLPDVTLPPSLAAVTDPHDRPYPRAPDERARAVEGYVDGRRLGPPDTCLVFAHVLDVARPERLHLEVAPYGAAEIFVDDARVATLPSARLAVLGNGVVVPLALEPGRHRLAVRTCPADGQVGFYALLRG